MQSAMANLDWIDSITVSKKKWDAMEPEEQQNFLPLGVLKQDTEVKEYCDMYEEVKKAHQGQRGKITQDDFAKKI
jgi:2-oxoglutarate ferredoxin oxidoreductase subunit beta